MQRLGLMNKYVLTLALLLRLLSCLAQRTAIAEELYGFRVGQYREVVLNELGKPAQTQVQKDSSKTDFYYLSRDSSTYVAFQYLPAKPSEIYAIQLSGKSSPRNFYGINLGENEKSVSRIFGRPDTIMVQEFNDEKASVWDYDRLHMSILLRKDKVESIRIWDLYVKDASQLQSLEDILKTVASGDKGRIADVLSPGLEVYYCGKIVKWKNSFYKDVYLERSTMMDLIINQEYGLITLARKKDLTYEENLRFIAKVGTYPVYKFKKGELLEEIVLDYQQGRYKIWEIRYACQQNVR